MFPILQLGPLAIQVPGLALLIGVWVGLAFTEREAARLNLKPDTIYNMAFAGLVAGIIGARLVYVARYLSAYAADPLGILSPNPGALAPFEGLMLGLLAAFVYGARHKLPLRSTLDALAPGLAVTMVAVALAHAASGDAFGARAQLPWRIYLWDDYRHPSQVYEMIAALVVLGAWRQARLRASFPGFNILLLVALSAVARVLLEAFRGDSLITVGGLRVAQLWGIAILAICLVLMKSWGGHREATAG